VISRFRAAGDCHRAPGLWLVQNDFELNCVTEAPLQHAFGHGVGVHASIAFAKMLRIGSSSALESKRFFWGGVKLLKPSNKGIRGWS
jgi:hypothetical protein